MQRYLPLKRKSSRLGDKYYRCLSERLTQPDTKLEIDECLKLGLQYRMALRVQLMDLGRFSDVVFVEAERRLIDKYLKLIDEDLDSLGDGAIDKIRNRAPRSDQ